MSDEAFFPHAASRVYGLVCSRSRKRKRISETIAALRNARQAKQISRSLRQELKQGLGERADPAAHCLSDRIPHRQLESPPHARIGIDPAVTHLTQRPLPRVVFLFAPPSVSVETNRVMADLVQEDREADRRLGIRALDPVHHPPVVMIHTPRAAAHRASPPAHAHVESRFHLFDDLIKAVGLHRRLIYRQELPRE